MSRRFTIYHRIEGVIPPVFSAYRERESVQRLRKLKEAANEYFQTNATTSSRGFQCVVSRRNSEHGSVVTVKSRIRGEVEESVVGPKR